MLTHLRSLDFLPSFFLLLYPFVLVFVTTYYTFSSFLCPFVLLFVLTYYTFPSFLFPSFIFKTFLSFLFGTSFIEFFFTFLFYSTSLLDFLESFFGNLLAETFFLTASLLTDPFLTGGAFLPDYLALCKGDRLLYFLSM